MNPLDDALVQLSMGFARYSDISHVRREEQLTAKARARRKVELHQAAVNKRRKRKRGGHK